MKRTERGFLEYGGFKDERDVTVYVRESSSATRRRVWLFVDQKGSQYDSQESVGAHLSAAQVRKLIKVLEKTLKHHRFGPA